LQILSVLIATVVLAGCGGGDFSTAKVTGRVVCEGQPVGKLLVLFEPIQSEEGRGAVVGKQGFGRTADDGTFEVSTYGNNDGAVVGRHRVRVAWSDDFRDPACPCIINSERDITEVDVVKGETNEVEIVLPKKPRGYRASLDDLEAMEEARDEDD
jgi:hypothetical protein